MRRDVEMPIGYRLVSLEETGSTNSEAMRLATLGEAGGLWITAERQTRGRGRSGRTWRSVPGNLYASLMLRLSCDPQTAQQLALVTGVAVVDAIRAASSGGARRAVEPGPGRSFRLKWPNDILAGPAKLGGILLESARDVGGPGLVTVIGIGLNVAAAPDGLDRAATSLADCGVAVERCRMLASVASAMDSALQVWNEGSGFADIRRLWLERAGPLDELLTVNSGSGAVTGRYQGLDGDGALLLADGLGVRRRFTYGDVSLAGTGEPQ